MLFALDRNLSIANHFLSELRDVSIQKDRLRFRRNLERVGELLAYEISKSLAYLPHEGHSPLAPFNTYLVARPVVLITILRAGVPFFQGFLNMFDWAESAFIGAYRVGEGEAGTLHVQTDYLAAPSLTGKTVIVADPMLATGNSLLEAYRLLSRFGPPDSWNVAAAIASQQGVDNLIRNWPGVNIWTGSIDPQLNSHAYIVPGLGDAGDLAYGAKL